MSKIPDLLRSDHTPLISFHLKMTKYGWRQRRQGQIGCTLLWTWFVKLCSEMLTVNKKVCILSLGLVCFWYKTQFKNSSILSFSCNKESNFCILYLALCFVSSVILLPLCIGANLPKVQALFLTPFNLVFFLSLSLRGFSKRHLLCIKHKFFNYKHCEIEKLVYSPKIYSNLIRYFKCFVWIKIAQQCFLKKSHLVVLK